VAAEQPEQQAALTEAAPADARTTPVALGALHELVVVLGPLAAECTPLAGAAAHVACMGAHTDTNTCHRAVAKGLTAAAPGRRRA
jgi:hypothetical protein